MDYLPGDHRNEITQAARFRSEMVQSLLARVSRIWRYRDLPADEAEMIANERELAGLAQRLTFEWRADDLVDLSRHVLTILRKEGVSMEAQAIVAAHILGYERDPSIDDIFFVLHQM